MTYSDDIVGLGHIRRNSRIAEELVRSVPGASVLMITGLPSGCFFDVPAGVDFMKLLSVDKIDTGRYRPRMTNMSQEIVRKIRADTIERTAEILQPDLFLVDHMPAGIWGELPPTLERLKAGPNPPKIVLGLRDVLDAPSVTRRLWQESDVYRLIERYYDAVLIYGDEGVVNTRLLYGLGKELGTRVEYCGYLCAPRNSNGTAGEAGRKESSGQRKRVVVTAGGGFDGFPLIASAIEAVRWLGPASPVELLCIAGPFMDRSECQDLVEMAKGLPVDVLARADDTVDHLEAADLVVSMAGYNTLVEALQLGKRIIAVPRSGPSAEQSIRARVFSERNLLTVLSPEEQGPRAFASTMLRALERDAPTGQALCFDGLSNAARVLSELASERGAGIANPVPVRRTQAG